MTDRRRFVARIDSAGVQIALLVDELREILHMTQHNMSALERVEHEAMCMSLDDALNSLRSGRKMFALVGYSTEKGAIAASKGLDMQHNEKQTAVANSE